MSESEISAFRPWSSTAASAFPPPIVPCHGTLRSAAFRPLNAFARIRTLRIVTPSVPAEMLSTAE